MESRCAICATKSPGPYDQQSFVVCTTSPADDPLSFCAKRNQHQCSCGQVFPILDRQPGIWDEQKQGMLNQNQFNVVAAPPSISSDQVADQEGTNNLLQSWSQENNGGQHACRPIRSSLVVFHKTGFNLDFPVWSRMIFKATTNIAFSHNSQRHLLGVSLRVCVCLYVYALDRWQKTTFLYNYVDVYHRFSLSSSYSST